MAVAPWAKVIWKTKDTIISGITWLLYDQVEELLGAPSGGSTEVADFWMRYQYRFSDIVSQDDADDQYVSFDILNHTDGQVDSTWTGSDFTNVHSQLYQALQRIGGQLSGRLTISHVAAYAQAFNAVPPEGAIPNGYSDIVPSGGPSWQLALNSPCTGGSNMAPQVCSTVTEETPARRHWGRIYLPTVGSGAVVNGRLAPTEELLYADAIHDAYLSLMGSDYTPVVVSTRANKGQVVHALQGITGVRTDDVLDVVRRRRFKNALHHTIQPLALAKPGDVDVQMPAA